MPVIDLSDIHNMNRDPVASPYILLIELEETFSGVVQRFCVNNEPVQAMGEEYLPISVEFTLPGKGEEQLPVKATVSNIDREAGRALLSASKRVMVRLMVIDFAAPDEPLMDTLDMFFAAEAPIGAEEIDITIAPVLDWLTPVPFYRTTENLFPGVWA